jgi:hypothetical protein
MTIDAASIVDAAHIRPFALFGNNDVRNGLALSKNAHWLFDNGLWTLNENYEVLVATRHFHEESLGQTVGGYRYGIVVHRVLLCSGRQFSPVLDAGFVLADRPRELLDDRVHPFPDRPRELNST